VSLLIRTLTYATLFIAFVLVWLPARLLRWAGVVRPPGLGAAQGAGMLVGLAGAAVALWCVATFAVVGRGTPAPFDPPRRLVVRGPYRFVRNPMYLGAAVALAGAALVYQSVALAGYTVLFLLLAHCFVIWYEEPHLRRTFGQEYDAYCARVRRWRPAATVRSRRDR
jgi:protein-S-isoprenylcysteine O-methyltransferase Ste14